MKPLIRCKWPLCPSFFLDTPKGKNHRKRHEKRKHDVPMNLLRSPAPPRYRPRGPAHPRMCGTYRPRHRPGRGGAIQQGREIGVVVNGYHFWV